MPEINIPETCEAPEPKLLFTQTIPPEGNLMKAGIAAEKAGVGLGDKGN